MEQSPGSATEYRYVTIEQLRRGLARRQVSAVELEAATHALLTRIAPEYNGLASLLPDRSAEEARAADQRREAGAVIGPLDGIPYGAKHLFAAHGAPTTWGSPAFRNQYFDEDAVAVGRASAPGASLHGQGRNAWDPARYSGGSSSGSGIAVALGLLPFALGSEIAGSIIGPAAFSGVTGTRPSFG